MAFISRGIRSLALVSALVLAIGLTQSPAHAAAATITPNPANGPVGSTVQLVANGFTGGQSVNIFFGSIFQGTVVLPASTTAFVVSFVVPNVAAGPVTITASSGSTVATTTFIVTAAVTSLTVRKSVNVNNVGYVTAASGHPGDQLTYMITVTNSTGAAVNGPITVTDQLGAGQSALVSTSNCAYTAATNTVTCTSPNALANGGSVSFFFTTVVNSGFSGNISNTAYASSPGSAARPSNTTVVTVLPVVTPTFALQICGVVTAFVQPLASTSTAGSITISGVRLSIASNATISGPVMLVGSSYCLTLVTNGSSVIISIVVGQNLTGLGLACGVVAAGTTTGSIIVGGIAVPLATATTLPSTTVSGVFYCFVLNSAGQVIAVLTSIPTSITFPHSGLATHRWAARAD